MGYGRRMGSEHNPWLSLQEEPCGRGWSQCGGAFPVRTLLLMWQQRAALGIPCLSACCWSRISWRAHTGGLRSRLGLEERVCAHTRALHICILAVHWGGAAGYYSPEGWFQALAPPLPC